MERTKSPQARVLLIDGDVVPADDGRTEDTIQIARALAPRYELDVLSRRTPDLGHIERFFGGRMLRVPVGDGPESERRQAFSRAVGRQLDSSEYDVVHLRQPWPGAPVLAARDRVEPRFQLVVEATAEDGGGPEDLLCAADRIVVSSHPALGWLAEAGFAKQGRHIGPAIDVDRFDRGFDERASGGGPAPTRVLVVPYAPDTVGPGDRRAELAAIAAEATRHQAEIWLWNGGGDIEARPDQEGPAAAGPALLGPMAGDELALALNQADVVALIGAPAEPAGGFPVPPPRVLLEAMACGLAPVAPATAVIRDFVAASGRVVEGGPSAVVEALGRLLGDPRAVAELANQARARIREGFTASLARAAWTRLYATLAPPGPAPRARSPQATGSATPGVTDNEATDLVRRT